MKTIKFNMAKNCGTFKMMNATNGGPLHKRYVYDQVRSNFEEYKAARIPYSRNHDSNACGIYGGPFAHDISAIFPNFDADETKPESYDFACTDESILTTLDAGTKTFFRLGQTIEHHIKKHDTLPPKDFHKWARICEHIIRHYTEGWADGLTLDMPYWEIWNEPDLDADDCPNKRTWGGVQAEFFDLYEITSKHLKKCFPHLKIGGPAMAWDEVWADKFLCEMQKRGVELDFYSWHVYGTEPQKVVDKASRYRAMLDKYGYTETESILNEWNYVRNWREEFVYSLEAIHGIKGASFVAAVMCESQKSSIDMLMYYDTRPGAFNGAFDFYTWRPLKGYYPLKWYGDFYDLDHEVREVEKQENLYSLAGVDKDGKATAMIVRFSEDDTKENETVKIVLNEGKEYEVYRIDKDHDGECVGSFTDLTFDMPVHCCLFIKEK